jgi:hypothetical protein
MIYVDGTCLFVKKTGYVAPCSPGREAERGLRAGQARARFVDVVWFRKNARCLLPSLVAWYLVRLTAGHARFVAWMSLGLHHGLCVQR